MLIIFLPAHHAFQKVFTVFFLLTFPTIFNGKIGQGTLFVILLEMNIKFPVFFFPRLQTN